MSSACVFKIDAEIQNAFPICVCCAALPQTGRLLPKTRRLLTRIGRKVYCEDAEGFFRKVLALYVPKSPKNGAASLMELLELHLGLPWLCLGFPEMCL